MGEIIIKHRAGGETRLQNKQATVKITKAEQRKQLLGEDTLNITIQSAQPIEIFIGDRIEIFGSVYTINQLPTIKKTGTRIFEQTIILEGTQYELIDVQFILPGNTMYDNLTGDLDDFIDVLIQNANRIYPGTWVKGFTPTGTETKTLSFSERNCLEVLQTLCEEYSTEFEIVVSTTGTRTLHIKQVGLQFPFPFTYGRTGGLYQLTRQNVNSKSVVTRLYVYGGRNNLGNTYRNSKLCLPGKLKNDSYIEDADAVEMYGVKENTKTFDKIFPARYGTVTSLGEETFTFHDSSMDFDLNETEPDPGAPAPEEGEEPVTRTKWLIPGISAKVRFTTGNLAGYEFDVHSYDHTTKEIKIVPFVDESGYKFPSETSSAFQIAIGDVYHFTDINLPLAYITEAEEKLETEGEKYYNKYRQPQVQYSLAIHPRFLEKYAGAPEVIPNIFALGDQIQIIDDDIGVNKSLRITGFTRDALDPYRYTLTLSEAAYNKTIINRIISDIEDITDIIELNNLADPFKARRNWMAAQELLDKIFDPEGYYYSEKIRPLSIETMMLQVGAKSQQFILQNTRFEPNHQGDPNAINIIGGQLVHYTLNDTITTWTLTSTTVTNLDPAKSYFVYAKCQADGDAGAIIIDDTQIKVDQDPMFYHFIIGHLSSVITNPDGSNPARILSLTYGSTTINGRFIKTGRIESSGGGSTYFDLDEGIISGNIRFISNGAEVDLSDWADQILAELGDVDGVISDLEEYIDGAFKDGIISEAEAKAIEKYINQINKEKNELEVVYNKTYLNPLLTGTPRTNLLNAKITLFGDITSLLNTINTAIADGATTPAEKQAVDAAFATYSSSLDLFTTRLEEARISIEQYLKGEADGARAAAAAAEAAANAAQNAVNDLDAYVDGAFKDGVIDAAEAKAIEKYKNTLNETMSKAEASYNKVYANTYLEGAAKTNLLNAKINLWGQRDTLLSAINTAIAGGTTTPAQKTAVDNAFSTFNTLMAAFQNALEEANKAIQTKLDDLSTEKVNNIQIGGRNLFSVNDFVADNKARGYSTIEVIEYEGNIAYRSSNIVNNHNVPRYLQGKFEANTQYYLQFKINWESYTNSGAQYIFYVRYTDGTISNLYASTSHTSRSMLTAPGKTIDYISTTRQYDGTVVIYEVQIEKSNKASDWKPAIEDVQAEIDAEKARINDILSDNVADPSEKQYLQNLWNEIYAEYPRIWAQAYDYGVDRTAYGTAYTNLNNTLTPVLADLTTSTSVSGATIRTRFSAYYDARTALQNAITNKVNQNAGDAAAIAADAQAKANTAKAITDKFATTIDGGLISTVMVLLRELNSQQDTAGISGIQGALKNQPAFWSGGKYEQAIGLIEFLHHMSEGTPPGTGEGQFDYQAKYQQLAPVAILHNGAAKVGDFLVLESGRIAMIDPSTGIPRLVFSVTDLPLIEDLISEIEDTGTVSNDSQNNVRGSYIFPNGINIEKNDSRLRFVLNWNSYLYVDGGDWGADGMVSFVLLRNGVYYDLISEFYVLADPYETASEQLYTVKDFESLPAGYYTVQATVQDLSGMDAVWADIGSSQLTYYFKLQGVRRQQYGRDGMMFYYSDHHFHFTEGGGLDGRALPDKWNAPGVLLSATILANGGWNRVWGAKQSPTPPPAPSPTGRYTIYHTIGHTNYQVNCISYTENRSFRVYAKNTNSVVVECRTIGSSPTLSNAMFDITMTGNNY